ncbi:MAG TPA: hypothetical protein VFR78_13895 [Pyrinomonadaceae bacterium]|nr:hypothetical protein [Pyrinomonadaceae bacterium]
MFSKIRRPKCFLLIVVALFCAITAVTASATLWRQAAATGGPNPQPLVYQSENRSGSVPALTLLPIQVRPGGFARPELTGPAGNYELLIINASGEPKLTAQLHRERGEKLHTIPVQGGKNSRKKLQLALGVYFLSFVEHPDWICRLDITNP